MSDLRTYQTLAYLTHRPDSYRDLLGLPKGSWRQPEGMLAHRLRQLGGSLLTRAGQWMLARAEQMEDMPAVPQRQQTV